MKTTLSGLIAGVLACTLAACTSTPMNSDTTMGSSSAGTTTVTGANGDNTNRGATPVNCTTNTTADGTTVAGTPGTNCPTEAH